MQELNIALVTIGALTLLLSLVAGLMRNKVYVVSEPMAAVILGMVIGPFGVDLLALAGWGDPFTILEQSARLTVGLAVMAAALRLPRRYFRANVRPMAVVLLPGMIVMWLVSGILVYLFLNVPLWTALLIGAIVTPTDPVLAGTIVTGSVAEQDIPASIRNFLSGEAGANDGLAYPIVFLPLLVLQHSSERAITEWLFSTLLWEVGAAVVIGATVGTVAGRIERKSREHDFLEETSLLSVTVAFTFTVLGGVKLLGSDGILAAFVAGLLFNRFADARDEADEQKVQETVLRLFTFPIFVFFGMAIPISEWLALGWAGVALAASILLLRRLPMMLLFHRYIRPINDSRDALFAGWFGPIGIAALFYATVAHRILGIELVWSVATLVIASSVLVHGVTATPFTKLYGQVIDRDHPQAADDQSSAFAEG
ncbi:cation:proton antiporter domain-containing protein [Natrialba asiatica]|uniref:Sodium/hydrogen exchanger n=1 Tax=Natrialba asiatica (strain ATCC 700177 / DSM 12278 / JCM 9576 / FERM P-10747 / NBRC 102637 / 172P1) TaxID=29540 RepID=M0B3U2_NATA1|nr:cation:proton antiporter [Natrialba asiatica]ELZ05465.1 sodium/hydrogen exchanger [Natrialba asiatica DSM 12278]